MAAPGARTRRASLTVLVAAALLVVLLGASGGSVELATEGCCGWTWDLWGDDPEPVRVDVPTGVDERGLRLDEPIGGDVVELIGRILLVVAVAAIAYLLGRAVLRTVRAVVVERLPDPGAWEAAAPTGRDELVSAVDASLVELRSGPVGDTIVACWVRLEAAVADAGVVRAEWETPSELTARVLGRLDAPPGATFRLLELYRTARYSQHQLGEAARAEAVESLVEIRAALALAASS